VQLPMALITPTLDSLASNFFEWRGAGTINPTPPLGAMWKSEGLFTAISFGFDRDHLRTDRAIDHFADFKQHVLETTPFFGHERGIGSHPIDQTKFGTFLNFLHIRRIEIKLHKKILSSSTLQRVRAGIVEVM